MRKILVVDDERDICEFVKNFLQERGYEVMTVSNGDDALAAVAWVALEVLEELGFPRTQTGRVHGVAVQVERRDHDVPLQLAERGRAERRRLARNSSELEG